MTDDDLIVRHAEHFLSRLDRLNTREVDLALGLYRDPDLLRAVLQQISLPDGADRVAVSLDDDVGGPFLVVTRDGHFVTCLAAGMTVGSLPIVTRGRLDAVSNKVLALRERLAEAARLTGGSDRACAVLLRRLLRNPDDVAREDFLANAAWEPLLAPVFMELYVAISCDLPLLAPRLRRLKTHKGRAGEALHAYWRLVHAAGHLALLATMGGEQPHYRALGEGIPGAQATLAFPLTNTGVVRFIVAGTWSAGRLGKQLLPAYERALGDDVSLLDLLDTVFALLAIGRRTTRLRDEIAKALRGAHRVARTPEAQRLRAAMGEAIETICTSAAELLPMEDAHFHRFVRVLGEAALTTSEAVADLPDEFLRTAAFTNYSDGVSDGRKIMQSMFLVAAAARGPAEELYFTRAVHDQLRKPWDPSDTELLLAPHRSMEAPSRRPVRRTPTPGANDPCPCGSGKKYKRCCRP